MEKQRDKMARRAERKLARLNPQPEDAQIEQEPVSDEDSPAETPETE